MDVKTQAMLWGAIPVQAETPFSAMVGAQRCTGTEPYENWMSTFDATPSHGDGPSAHAGPWSCVVSTSNGRFKSVQETQFPLARSQLAGLQYARKAGKADAPQPVEEAVPAGTLEYGAGDFAVQPFPTLVSARMFRIALQEQCNGITSADVWRQRALQMAGAHQKSLVDISQLD